MLALRILSLPLAMTAFTVLCVLANKAPEAVEAGNVFLWLSLTLIFAVKFFRIALK